MFLLVNVRVFDSFKVGVERPGLCSPVSCGQLMRPCLWQSQMGHRPRKLAHPKPKSPRHPRFEPPNHMPKASNWRWVPRTPRRATGALLLLGGHLLHGQRALLGLVAREVAVAAALDAQLQALHRRQRRLAEAGFRRFSLKMP